LNSGYAPIQALVDVVTHGWEHVYAVPGLAIGLFSGRHSLRTDV